MYFKVWFANSEFRFRGLRFRVKYSIYSCSQLFYKVKSPLNIMDLTKLMGMDPQIELR